MALHWERHRGVRLSSVSRAIALGSVAAVGVAACMTQIAPEPATVDNGRQIFRFDTFGNEQFWTDTLHLDRVVQSAVDPTTALGVGLKVDMDALPAAVVQGIQAGQVDLKSPATTVTLLKLNAVVGVKGTVETRNGKDTLTRLGITCAFCHSTVDDAFAKGIGHRRDGWPNRDLNVGAIVALSPALTAAQKAVYSSWGPGMYDPRYNIDGKNTPLVIPPAYGLAQTNNETYTAEGPISYWNAYVAVTQLAQHAPYFHDGSAKTLADVVEHYNRVRSLSLNDAQKRDLVEYLKSL